MKQDIVYEVKMCLDALQDDVANVKTNKNSKQSYNFKISWIWAFESYIYLSTYIVYANEV